MPQRSVEELIIAARAGDTDALGMLLEHHRDQLRRIARQKLDSVIQGRIDPSDVIQQTFLEAEQGFHTFRGEVGRQFFAWLRKILENNVANTVQFHLHAGKRSVLRERPDAADDLRGRECDRFAAAGSSPSHQLKQSEERELVLRYIKHLPAAQRHVIRMRYLEDRSLNDIATKLNRSRESVAGLLKRGLRQLRSQMTIEQRDSMS